ncbi:hypothetical protein HY469_02975 [Candidatus Roizmanbacteria bacterium]|nr:hypothetical protein [Candidatus Roizmanbacteria bacterium]
MSESEPTLGEVAQQAYRAWNLQKIDEHDDEFLLHRAYTILHAERQLATIHPNYDSRLRRHLTYATFETPLGIDQSIIFFNTIYQQNTIDEEEHADLTDIIPPDDIEAMKHKGRVAMESSEAIYAQYKAYMGILYTAGGNNFVSKDIIFPN